MQTVKSLCAELFTQRGGQWSVGSQEQPASASFSPVTSPHGCFVTQFLASDEDLRQLTAPARAAPEVQGGAPRLVSGQRNTALYNAHSYHTKVPPEAIVPFLEHFTRPGDIVLDPFCGSGMTGVAASLTGRRAILSDLSVAAVHLAYNHTRPCSTADLSAAFEALAKDLEDEFRELYACTDGRERGYVHYTLWSRDAICPACNAHFSMWDAIDRETGRMPAALKCPQCGRQSAKHALRYADNHPVLLSYERHNGERVEREPTDKDLALLKRYTRESIHNWYPKIPVENSREMYIRSALHLQGIQSVADFYTPRNLYALARLWHRIQQVGDERVRAALAFAFTNTSWHGTRMRRFNARGGQRPLTGTLYIPQLSSEANVLEVMRNKIRQLRSYYTALGSPVVPPPAIRLGSATHLSGVPEGSVDYVFTDPPFGSNIFYADCNLIWESWLGGVTRLEEEAVVNRSRDVARGGKTVQDYQRLMAASMHEIHRVLKPGAWATLVFHNTDPDVWRAIQSAAEEAGFQIEDAGALDRKQQSHKGYKGRAEQEEVAHFDVIMSMRKHEARRAPQPRPRPLKEGIEQFVQDAYHALPSASRTVQRVHSEVLQRLAKEGRDLGAVSFSEVRALMPSERPGQLNRRAQAGIES
jgi:16S rRNA G966 N2-methylase RsmD